MQIVVTNCFDFKVVVDACKDCFCKPNFYVFVLKPSFLSFGSVFILILWQHCRWLGLGKDSIFTQNRLNMSRHRLQNTSWFGAKQTLKGKSLSQAWSQSWRLSHQHQRLHVLTLEWMWPITSWDTYFRDVDVIYMKTYKPEQISSLQKCEIQTF